MDDAAGKVNNRHNRTRGSIDRAASPQSTSVQLVEHYALHQGKGVDQRNPETQLTNEAKRLLTSKIQRQRSQRGVVPQRIAQRIRSSIIKSIDYTDTPEWRDRYRYSANQFQWATLLAR
jgi:hypothetical protein